MSGQTFCKEGKFQAEQHIINIHIKAKEMLSPNTVMTFDNRSPIFASLNDTFLSSSGFFASLKAHSFLVSKVQGSPETVLLMEMLRRGSKKQETGPRIPQEPLPLTKALSAPEFN